MNQSTNQTSLQPRNFISSLRSDPDFLRLNVITIVVFIVLSIVTGGRIYSVANFESMGFMLPELALFSLAMMLSMLTGGIDLSIVAIANLAGIVAALILTHLLPVDANATTTLLWVAVALIASVSTGAVCGAINGLLIARFQFPAILATLGTMQLFTGAALVITDGKAISGLPKMVQTFGNGNCLGIPIPFFFLSSRLRFGF